MLHLAKRAAAAVLPMLLCAAAAAASPATLERRAVVRSGPGTAYRAIATLAPGSAVEAGGCGARWCRVAWAGGRGYVARAALAPGGTPGVEATAPATTYYGDDYPGFDYPGYVAAPTVTAVAPRWHRDRRRLGWHHRRPPGPAWAGYPPQPATGAMGAKTFERGGAFARPAPVLTGPAMLPPTTPGGARPPATISGARPMLGVTAPPASAAKAAVPPSAAARAPAAGEK